MPQSFVIIPCPYEKTTSYGKGTKNGPRAILSALQNVESFDEELGFDIHKKAGIHTLKPVKKQDIAHQTTKILKGKKIPILLGGEHSISIEAVKAAREIYPDLSVLQLDAHADLRDAYKGNKTSHACVMKRILEICPAVQAGVRSISEKEWVFAEKTGQIKKIHFACLAGSPREAGRRAEHLDIAEKIVRQLSNKVYITFDVDAFDPAIMPSTGTPEPGGLLWYEVLDILRAVCMEKTVVGADFVELMPIKGFAAPDFMAAKLIYKTIGYISQS